MGKSPDAFRTIGEVSSWLGVPTHVLRFWESKFAQVKPVKRQGGRRYYRPGDMALLGGIKVLLHDRGMTIKGVQRILTEDGADAVISHAPELDGYDPLDGADALDGEDGGAADGGAGSGMEDAGEPGADPDPAVHANGADPPEEEVGDSSVPSVRRPRIERDGAAGANGVARSPEPSAPSAGVEVEGTPSPPGALPPPVPQGDAGADGALDAASGEGPTEPDQSDPQPEGEPLEKAVAIVPSGGSEGPRSAEAGDGVASLRVGVAEAGGAQASERGGTGTDPSPPGVPRPGDTDHVAAPGSSDLGPGAAAGGEVARNEADDAPIAGAPPDAAPAHDAGPAAPPPPSEDADGDEERSAPDAAEAAPGPPPADADGAPDPHRAAAEVPPCQEEDGTLARRPEASAGAVRANHDAILALVRRLEAVRDRMGP